MTNFLAVLLALVLCVALSATASAAEGNFLVAFTLDGARVADPIGGAQHLHDFALATGVDNMSTPWSVVSGGTNGQVSAETAGLWHPAIVKPGADGNYGTADDTRVDFDSGTIYYRNIDPSTPAMPFPFGLKHVEGSATNTDPNQAVGIWRCYGSGASSRYIPTNCNGGYIQEDIYTNFCWDGLSLDGPGHHTLKPPVGTGVQCGGSTPIKLPAINLTIYWPPAAAGGKLTSDVEHDAAGGITTHYDYWAVLEPFFSAKFTERCLNAGIQCRVGNGASGTRVGNIYQFGTSPAKEILTPTEAAGAF